MIRFIQESSSDRDMAARKSNFESNEMFAPYAWEHFGVGRSLPPFHARGSDTVERSCKEDPTPPGNKNFTEFISILFQITFNRFRNYKPNCWP